MAQEGSKGTSADTTDPGAIAAQLRERRKESAYRKSRAQAAVKKGPGAQRAVAGMEIVERHDPLLLVKQFRASGTWASYKAAPKGEVESLRIRALATPRGKAPPPGPRGLLSFL